MASYFFQTHEGRTGFFKSSSDSQKLFELIFLLIQAATEESEKITVANKWKEVKEILTRLLDSHILFKIALHHSKERISFLEKKCADPDGSTSEKEISTSSKPIGVNKFDPVSIQDLASREAESILGSKAVNTESLTLEEQGIARLIISQYFESRVTSNPQGGLSLDVVYGKMTPEGESDFSEKKHSLFFSNLFMKIFGVHILPLRENINEGVFGNKALGLVAKPGEERPPNIIDYLIEALSFLFEVMLSSIETSESLQSVSERLDSLHEGSNGKLVESVDLSFGEVRRSLSAFLPMILGRCDDANLRSKIAPMLVPQAIISNAKQETQRRSMASFVDFFNAEMTDMAARMDLNSQLVTQARKANKGMRGEILRLNKKINEQKNDQENMHPALTKELSQKTKQVEELRNRVSTLQESEKDKDRVIADNGKRLRASIADRRSLRKDLENTRSDLLGSNLELAKKQKEIESLRLSLSEKEADLKKANQVISDQNLLIARLKKIAMVELSRYCLKREREATNRKRREVNPEHRNTLRIFSPFTYKDKMQAAEAFRQFVDRDISEVCEEDLKAWNNKRLSGVVFRHAKRSLEAYGVKTKRLSKSRLINLWVKEENERNPVRKEPAQENTCS